MARPKVYCAGPLFNEKEREEMLAIASALEEAGFATFLPQRDGLELTRCAEKLVSIGFAPGDASRMMTEAVFALDVYQVLYSCSVIIANLNGRVPDEGTVSEASMAWARGKPVVGYKTDSRTAFAGQDNPLVSGLFGFALCHSIAELVRAVGEKANLGGGSQACAREEEIAAHARMGREITAVLEKSRSIDLVAEIVCRYQANGALAS